MDQSMMDLITEYKKYYDLEHDYKSKWEEAKGVRESFEQVLYDKMAEEGVQNIKTDKGLFYLREDRYVSIKPDEQVNFFAWLIETGNGDLIRPTIHSKTLTSWVNEQTDGKELEEGDELNQYVNVFTKHRVGIRGGK
jgi:hypothetical protein